eukprot:2296630-Pyramimonas_sp.AAC.1
MRGAPEASTWKRRQSRPCRRARCRACARGMATTSPPVSVKEDLFAGPSVLMRTALMSTTTVNHSDRA